MSVDNPGKLQIVLEDITTFIVAQLDAAIGHGKGRKYLALCGGIFVFILIGNLMGQIPGLGAPTSNINVPFGCAITVWLYYHWQGIKAQGLGDYLLHFAFPPGMPKAMAPLMLPIELISHLSRVLSLTLRLFGNIFGEHLVVLIIASIVPFIAPLPIQMLGLDRRPAAGVHLHDADGDLSERGGRGRRTPLTKMPACRVVPQVARRCWCHGRDALVCLRCLVPGALACSAHRPALPRTSDLQTRLATVAAWHLRHRCVSLQFVIFTTTTV